MSRGISIHAPRTGSDGAEHYQRHPDRAISIHAPRTGSDENHRRGRTARPHFNPRSPHGERQDRAFLNRRIEISIHAPRTGSDFRRSVKGFPPKYFNPRSPHGERRRQEPLGTVCPEISIHAPRTGSDERIYQHLTFTHGFQSTLPARGATSSTFADLLGSAHFNPRSPHGERRAGESRLRRADSISIHAPRTGSDRSGAGRTAVHLPISIHAPRTGSDIINNSTFETIKISIHAPRTGSDGNPAVQCQ